jgi:exopolyphosphatase/guanosine-5'-triphosphate,3'-diphosphate pyrophosphatase
MAKTLATIDIGSNATVLTIFEIDKNNAYKTLDKLFQPLRLGKDTFVDGRINRAHFDQALEILLGFKRVIKEYGVEKVIAVATSAVREADNQFEFIDFLKNQSGIGIRILEDTEEKKILFQAMVADLEGSDRYLKGNSLMIELGAGNVKTLFVQDKILSFSLVHKIGALRVKEILGNINIQQHKFENVLREFIHTDVQLLFSELQFEKVDRFIVVGGLIPDLLLKILSAADLKKRQMPSEALLNTLKKYKKYSIDQFSTDFQLTAERAEILLPTLFIFIDFLNTFQPKYVMFSDITLTDGLIIESIGKRADFFEHVMSSVKYLGRRYKNDDRHAEVVHDLAVEIFDNTKRLHKLKAKYLIVLKIAAWLHDIGRFVNGREHHKHSEYIIANATLPGITKKQLKMAAVVARNHRRFTIKYGDNLDVDFDDEDRLIIKKLSAILRLANSLDLGHLAARDDIQVRHQKDKNCVCFDIRSDKELILEEWGFNGAKSLFESMFNVVCLWKVVRGR